MTLKSVLCSNYLLTNSMKHLIALIAFFFSTMCFAQHSGVITGKLLDKAFDNNPLVFADVAIKGTTLKSTTDQTGLFFIENIADGDYTLVCSFVGYETKEIKIKVASGTSEFVKTSLNASTIALDEFAALVNTAEKHDKALSK